MPKPFLTYDQQIDNLANTKKLQINNNDSAKESLKNIGYFSLIGGYKTPFIDPMTRIYQNNASFDDIFALYHFDLLLRELVFKYLCECAHNERLYSFRIQIDFPDTILHSKLGIEKKGIQYIYGKRDLFGLVIALRYLLPNSSFLDFKRSLIKILKLYQKQSQQINENTLLQMMGFPKNWKSISRYHL